MLKLDASTTKRTTCILYMCILYCISGISPKYGIGPRMDLVAVFRLESPHALVDHCQLFLLFLHIIDEPVFEDGITTVAV